MTLVLLLFVLSQVPLQSELTGNSEHVVRL